MESTDVANNLKWNRYTLWDAGVNKYNVYRGFDFGSGFTWNILSTMANTDSLYSDSNFPLDVGIAGTCYYVEADEQAGNKYGEQSVSKSNTICLVEDAVIYFPNAFVPQGVNTLFLPVGANIDYNRSNMLIYARNGQLMKKIDNVSHGWNGTNLDGEMCPQGVYVYICEIFGLNEKKYNFKGTVHLLQ
jgi:gliding motility-associated-like protein